MKVVLLALGGFFAGFGAVLGLRGHQPIPPAELPSAAPAELRRVEVPRDFATLIATRLAKARASAPDASAVRELQRDIDRWMLADPMGCVEFLHRNDAIGLVRIEHLPAVFAGAFRGDLALAIREAMHLPDARLRFEWLNAAFQEAAQTSPERALELLAYVPADRRALIGDKLMKHYAEKDPASAWRAVVSSRSSPYQHGSLWRKDEYAWANVVLDIWGERDPTGLADFLRSKFAAGGGDWEARVLVEGLEGFSQRRHASQLLGVLAGMDRNPALEKFWRQALKTVARKDPEAALQIGMAQSRALARDRAAVIIAETVGVTDFDRGIALLDRVSAEPARIAAVQAIITKSAETNPVAAAQRAEKIENLLGRADAMRQVAWVWYSRHTTAKFAAFALETGVPEAGPSWLGVIAERLRQSGDNGGNWGRELDAVTRERFEVEMQSRMSPEGWAKVESIFRPYKARKESGRK
jgi:hypothetical protein